jgi:thiamine kinase-like enzyme
MGRTPLEIARDLPVWSGPVVPVPVSGGITNANFLVEDGGRRCFVRVGSDIPVHGIMRAHEAQASAAAAECGLSPALLHVVPGDPGALVFAFVAGRTLAAADLRDRAMLARVVPLLRRCHRDMPACLRGAVVLFWPFQVLRGYARTLRDAGDRRDLAPLEDAAAALARAVGPVDPVDPVDLVFGHNDLLPANLIDDGARLWLIDWEYAGFDSPLFDLANLASNAGLAEDDERWLLEAYFGAPADAALWRRYRAMLCASLLRETMWSMVQETHAAVAFDYAAYTADYGARFDAAYAAFSALT